MPSYTISRGGTATTGALAAASSLNVLEGAVELSTDGGTTWDTWGTGQTDRFSAGLTVDMRNNRNRDAVVVVMPA